LLLTLISIESKSSLSECFFKVSHRILEYQEPFEEPLASYPYTDAQPKKKSVFVKNPGSEFEL